MPSAAADAAADAAASAAGLRAGALPFTPRPAGPPRPSPPPLLPGPSSPCAAAAAPVNLARPAPQPGPCWFVHDCSADAAAAAVAASAAGPQAAAAAAYQGAGHAQDTAWSEVCGICLEQPDKTEAIQNSRVTRLCPVCRTFSDIVIPSSFFLVGERKVRAQTAYKESMSRTPCKYFVSSKGATCPYGDECFFAHNNASGQRVHVSRPQRRQRQNRSFERRPWTSVHDM
ncbi:MAG: hypothetical protein BJ554DRAFT_2908, partial [Olpidium bornovanus]